MAQFVDGGTMAFDALLYGRPHPGTQQFLAAQFENLANMSQHLSEAGQRFMSGAAQMYEQVAGSQATRALRAMGRAIRSMWQLDEIRPLRTMGDFQHAPLSMQRWIMAEPTVRQAFQEQRLDGYSETYVDVHPGDIGESHYDFRRVMTGVIVDAPDLDSDGEHYWTARTYLDELLPEDSELSLAEKSDILETWDLVKAYITRGKEDPTSRFNADLS